MVFLDFFEALVECALVYVTEDMIPKKEAQDGQKSSFEEAQNYEKRSSFETKELSKDTSPVSVTEHSLSQVKLMQTCPVLLRVHLESEVRP